MGCWGFAGARMGRFVTFRYHWTRLKTSGSECALGWTGLTVLLPLLAATPELSAADSAPLSIETRIPLGDVRGRIDHLAVDLRRQRLYVAELGNNTVGVIDLKQAKILRTLGGLQEPQGIGYESSTDTVRS